MRLKYLDAVRGVAALSVLGQHVLQCAGVGLGSNVNLGRFGVVLFFMLSGFVIPFSFSGDQPLRRFLITRFFRLYPAYWASLIVAAFMAWSVSWDTLLANITMVQMALGYPDVVSTYWSLFYELVFYALCILLFMLGMPTRAIGILAVGLTLFSVVRFEVMYVAFMLAGTLMRKAWLEEEPMAEPWVFAVLVLLLLRSVWIIGTGGTADSTGFGVGSILAALTFLAAAQWQPRSAIAEWVGQCSYSLYLLHIVIILAMPTMWLPFWALAVTALSIMAARLSFLFVEKPAMASGKALAARKQAVPANAVI